jgi:hypothetical protein
MIVALASTAFLILATFGIQPELRLPAWLIGVLTPIIFSEYVLFLSILHTGSLEIYDKSSCKTRLAILRVSKTRSITFLGLMAASFSLAFFGFLNIALPLPAAFPYYTASNIYYLTRFQVPKDKQLQTAFDSLKELPSLSRFYQSMTLGLIGDRIEQTVKKSVPLARKIDSNPLLRALYVGHSIPSQSPGIEEESLKLKEALTKESQDIYEAAERVAKLIPPKYGNAGLTFQLPWESKLNWGLLLSSIFGLIDAVGTIIILQNAGLFIFAYRLLTGK